ncbi:MAG: hypothetical protein HFH53_08490 [Hespellia sp.]|jgi:hypothetical protein|nr:hypothetical protein [Hespellia sp.]
MKMNELLLELDCIHYKYERLESLIGILQMYVSEVVEVSGEPENSLGNALFEIEAGMNRANKEFKDLVRKGGVV